MKNFWLVLTLVLYAGLVISWQIDINCWFMWTWDAWPLITPLTWGFMISFIITGFMYIRAYKRRIL